MSKILNKIKRINVAKLIRKFPISNERKNKLIASLYYYLKLKPQTLVLDTVSKCNALCPFCPHSIIGIKGTYIDKNLFYKVVDEAKALGIKECRLYSTGEPLMHPNIDEFIDYLRKNNFFIILSTNGEFLDKHFEAVSKVDWVKFSIEGWDKESYEYYRKNCHFEKVKENIKNFNYYLKNKKNKPTTSISVMINKETNLTKFLNLWKPIVDRIDYSATGNMIKWTDGKPEQLKFEGRLKENMWDYQKKQGYKYCSAPFEEVVVSAKGNAILCCNDFDDFTNMIDLQKFTIKDFLNTKERKQHQKQFLKQHMDICAGCGALEEMTDKSQDHYNKIVNSLNEQN